MGFQVQIRINAVVPPVSTTVLVIIPFVRTPRAQRLAVGIRILYCANWERTFGAVQLVLPSVPPTKLVVMWDSAPAMVDILPLSVLPWNAVLLAPTAATETRGGG